MKRFLVAFFILLLWSFAGFWIYLCKIKSLCADSQSYKNITDEQSTLENAAPENTVNMVSYSTREMVAIAKDTTAAEKTGIFSHHKILYFGFDSEKHKTDKALREYISSLKAYLEIYTDKNISITGHTDNVGKTADNDWIGMQRAKNAMKYLISQGISKEKIILFSKGETEPIAPNTTKEGRQRNRRVEISIH